MRWYPCRLEKGWAVLEVFKELIVEAGPTESDTFIEEITARLAGDWSRDDNSEKRLVESGGTVYYAFRRVASESLPAATLYLIRNDDGLTLANIVPLEKPSLARSEYNAVVDAFVHQFASPAAGSLGLMIQLTDDHLPITAWVSEPAYQRLKAFSDLANKSTGSSHPYDFKRWAAFLIQVHRDNSKLDTEMLKRWLIELERWDEERGTRLAIEFEFARDLLKAYDAEHE